MKPIELNAILDSAATRSDGGVKLVFSTGEFSAEEMAVLFKLLKINLRMLLTATGQPLEAPVEVKSELSNKSSSQRLRGVLFVLFRHLQSKGASGGKTWDIWYGETMEKIIDEFKQQLPEQ